MRKALLPFVLLAGIAGMIATSPYHVSADRRQNSSQASMIPVAVNTAAAHLQPVVAQTKPAQVQVASAISVPETGGLFLMGFGLLISAIYLRKKLLHQQK